MSRTKSISLDDMDKVDGSPVLEDSLRAVKNDEQHHSLPMTCSATDDDFERVSTDLTDLMTLEDCDLANLSLPTVASSPGHLSSGLHPVQTSRTLQRPLSQEKEVETDTTDKIKMKLMSAWNNVKYTVKSRTNFKVNDPLWFLGRCYHSTLDVPAEMLYPLSDQDARRLSMDKFKQDFISRLWFTYRKDFGALQSGASGLSSDVGWGCMLRSAQMMLAQALVTHFLGRDWRYHHQDDWRWTSAQRLKDLHYHRQIIKLFGDFESHDSPLGIHNLTKIGANMGKVPGDWYGPASAAHVLSDVTGGTASQLTCSPLLARLCVYVAQDCTVYKQDVVDLCTQPAATSRRYSAASVSSQSSSDGDSWRGCVVLIPVRLGGEIFNPVYTPCLQSALAHELCIGIIGGKPKHSLYFCGWQGDKLVYLDPHFCQQAVDMHYRDFKIHTFHCMSPRKTAFTKADPSCTMGFYCSSRQQFERFCRDAAVFSTPPKEKGLYPMFVFHEGRACDVTSPPVSSRDKIVRVRHVDERGRVTAPPNEKDDFVFL